MRFALLVLLVAACGPDELPSWQYPDGDGDGWALDVDCADHDASVHPDAVDACDGVDQDCDGEIDEDADDVATFYADGDADGYGVDATTVEACAAPAGYAEVGGDCDDGDAAIHPGAADECDGVDQDCDTEVDEDADDVATFYADGDSDGYGVDDVTVEACAAPEGYAAVGGDCDDGDAAFHPGAEETDCTSHDDLNCDGSVGFVDGDGDGFAACVECDDADAAVNPDATEVCGAADDDCDGAVDDADLSLDLSTAGAWYADTDADGHGAGEPTAACAAPAGFVASADDCDDTSDAVSPDAAEVCDTADVDEDCDGDADDDDADVTGTAVWSVDDDGDGYGDQSGTDTLARCDPPSGYVSDATDCDDGDDAVNPAAVEVCDDADVDEDCDGAADDADPGVDPSTMTTWYADVDADGYGDATHSTSRCSAPSGWEADATDCHDGDASVNPGAAEVCGDGVDNDCAGGDEVCPA